MFGCAEGSGGTGYEAGDAAPARRDDGLPDATTDDAGNDAYTPDTPDAGGDAMGDAGSEERDAGIDLCLATTSCTAPVMLGSVAGDVRADVLQYRGAGSAFLTVYLKEEDGGLIRKDIKIAARLTSPRGSNFDLYMYAEQDMCGVVTSSSTTTFMDRVSAKWSEGLENKDESRTIVFEVRHVSGPCSDATPWELQILGNSDT